MKKARAGNTTGSLFGEAYQRLHVMVLTQFLLESCIRTYWYFTFGWVYTHQVYLQFFHVYIFPLGLKFLIMYAH